MEQNEQSCLPSVRAIAAERLSRLELLVEGARLTPPDALDDPRPWVAVVSSRLGHDLSHQRALIRYLHAALRECDRRDGVLLIAVGSAIEPLAARAATHYRIPVIRVAVTTECPDSGFPADLLVTFEKQSIGRDEVVISLADRVDILSVKPKGRIERAVVHRLSHRSDASIRVAVDPDQDAPLKLIERGAVGWWLARSTRDRRDSNAAVQGEPTQSMMGSTLPARWMSEPDAYLVHCTRSPQGPWPNEPLEKFLDELLLSSTIDRTAMDALERIVRGGVLMGSAQATDHRWPVVCFSALPLDQLLNQRCYRSHLHRWDYEPYGIAIRRSAADQIGAQEVIYGDSQDRELLSTHERYRFQSRGRTYDWTVEQEWRTLGNVDLSQLEVDDVRVFTATEKEAARLQPLSAWKVDWVRNCQHESARTRRNDDESVIGY